MRIQLVMASLALFAQNSFAAQCIAHRGYFEFAAENSLGSIRHAIELGADGVEVDIRHTKDGVPILMHDETLARVVIDSADCPGQELISELNFEQIANNCLLKDGQNISTLEAALEVFANNDVMAFLEIKDKPSQLMGELVQNSNLDYHKTRFISFKTKYLRRAKKIMPDVKSLRLSRFVPFFSFTRGMNVDKPLRRYTFVARLFGNEVGVWTINSFAEMVDNHQRKIDYITTDKIELCLKAKDEIR